MVGHVATDIQQRRVDYVMHAAPAVSDAALAAALSLLNALAHAKREGHVLEDQRFERVPGLRA